MFEVTSGPVARPIIGLVYGPPGIGKTHLASCFSSNTLVFDIEDGTKQLDVKRAVGQSHEDVLKFLPWIAGKEEYDAVVIDSITALEQMGVDYTCRSKGWRSLEQGKYGAGHGMYRNNMQRVFREISHLKARGKSVILVGHSQVKNVNDPTQQTYDRMEYNIDKNLQPILTSMVDFCFYLRPEVLTADEQEKELQKPGTHPPGGRELVLSAVAHSISKNRFPHMPKVIRFPEEVDPVKLKRWYSTFWNRLKNPPVPAAPKAAPAPEPKKDENLVKY